MTIAKRTKDMKGIWTMNDINDRNITELILKKPKAVVDFWAPWCHPCMQFKPVFEKVGAEHPDVSFGKVNIEDYRDIALEFGVMSIPTIIFFKHGEEVGRFTGTIPEEAFKARIKEFFK
jgi:thioredoxin 1